MITFRNILRHPAIYKYIIYIHGAREKFFFSAVINTKINILLKTEFRREGREAKQKGRPREAKGGKIESFFSRRLNSFFCTKI